MRVTIDVTERDIKYGRQEHVNACMVARAARRVFKPRRLEVDGESINFRRLKDTDLELELPKHVRQYILRWDINKQGVKPFTFNLDVPAELVRKNASPKVTLDPLATVPTRKLPAAK